MRDRAENFLWWGSVIAWEHGSLSSLTLCNSSMLAGNIMPCFLSLTCLLILFSWTSVVTVPAHGAMCLFQEPRSCQSLVWISQYNETGNHARSPVLYRNTMGAAAGVYSLPAVSLLLRQVLQTEDMFPAELPRKLFNPSNQHHFFITF